MRLSLLLLLLILPATLFAQGTGPSFDQSIERVLDQPGIPSLDAADLSDYFDANAPSHSASLMLLHSDPQTSWMDARRLLHTYTHDSVAPFQLSLRSRLGRSFDPYAQKGYTNNQYLGDPNGIYNRLKVASALLTLAVLQQKQSWEPKFADQLNGYVALANALDLGPVVIKNAVAGDYSISYGEGLLFGNGISASKAHNAASAIEQRAYGFRPTLSNNSAHSFRGIALEFESAGVGLSLLGSSRSIDANITEDSITGLPITGYHRTANELAARNKIELSTIAAHVQYSTPDSAATYWQVGGTAYMSHLTDSYSTSSSLYSKNDLSATSLDVNVIGSRFSLHGEGGIITSDTQRTHAMIAAGSIELLPGYTFSLQYRYLPNTIFSPFGQTSMGSISSLANAEGLYAGLTAIISRQWLVLNAYSNLSNDLIGSIAFPDHHRDHLLSLTSQPLSSLTLSSILRYQQYSKIGLLDQNDRTVYSTLNGSSTNIRFDIDWEFDKIIRSRSRYEHVSIPDSHESGYLLSQEITTSLSQTFSLTLRGVRYLTDSFESAIYYYETGVTGTGSILALYDRGTRLSGKVTKIIGDAIRVSADVAGTIYDRAKTIGSGLTEHIAKSDFSGTLQLEISIR